MYCAAGCMNWGSDSSIINNPLRKPGRTPLYVSLPSVWGSVDSDQMFSPFVCEGIPLYTSPWGKINDSSIVAH
jgi:hypothetical protein